MANVLIAYATRDGQTKKIAERMAGTLRAHGHGAELLDLGRARTVPDLSRYQRALVGGPVRLGRYPRRVERFIEQHREFLESVPSAFFSVNLAIASRTSDGRAQTLPLVRALEERTGWKPRRVELFAGALLYTRYNFLVRYVMKRIAASEGGDTDTSRDYEYTDFDAVERFALDFASEAGPRDAAARVREAASA